MWNTDYGILPDSELWKLQASHNVNVIKYTHDYENGFSLSEALNSKSYKNYYLDKIKI